jgi:hypothetical protein
LSPALEKSGIWDKMNLYREEIIFAKEFLQEMGNRGIEKFPFGTKKYRQALQKVKEKFELEGKIPTPLDTLLVSTPRHGEFPRMDVAIQYNFGRHVAISAPRYEEIITNFPRLKVKDPLVKKVAEMFIKELNLS